MLYLHGKQLKSCRDSQLLYNTVPGKLPRGSLPVIGGKMIIFLLNTVPEVRVSLTTTASEAFMQSTELPRPVFNRFNNNLVKIN